MRFRIGLMGLWLAPLCTLAHGSHLDLIESAKHAFAVLPATAVTDGDTSMVTWSPSGDRLMLASRSDASSAEALLSSNPQDRVPGPFLILGWDRETRSVKRLWSSEDRTISTEQICWIPRSPEALVTLTWSAPGQSGATQTWYGVLAINAATGEFRWISGLEALTQRPEISASPTTAQVVIEYSDLPEAPAPKPETGTVWNAKVLTQLNQIFTIVQGNGNSGPLNISITFMDSSIAANNFLTMDGSARTIRSARMEKVVTDPIRWNADGSAWFLEESDGTTHQPTLYQVTEQGQMIPTSETAFVSQYKAPELDVETIGSSLTHGKVKVSTRQIWLSGEPASAHAGVLLSADGTDASLSPTGGAVFYVDGGVAKVREIVSVTPAQLAAADKFNAGLQYNFVNRVFNVTFTTDAAKPVP